MISQYKGTSDFCILKKKENGLFFFLRLKIYALICVDLSHKIKIKHIKILLCSKKECG